MKNLSVVLAKQGLINIAHLVLYSCSNGPGHRAVIWLQGCSIHCEGCVNRSLWDFTPHSLVYPEVLIERICKFSPNCDGLTITGGEPFDQIAALEKLTQSAKNVGLTTLIYTGYYLNDLRLRKDPVVDLILQNADILIDGPFVLNLRCSGPGIGSTNQQIHFLTSRYSRSVLETPCQWPHEEYILEQNQSLIHTGIFQQDKRVR